MNAVPLMLIGIDFRSAPTRYRAALGMDASQRDDLVATLREHGAEGLVVIETCNRCEWLVVSERAAWVGQLLAAHMVKLWQAAGFSGAMPRPYRYEGEAAVQHLFRVASGLESFVLGERQIAGQLQRAFTEAREADRSCSLLNVLGSCSGRVVRKLQRRGSSGSPSTGVQLLAWEVIAERCGEEANVGVVGMGEIGQRTVEILRQRGCSVVCFNRTLKGREIHGLADLPDKVATLDVVVVASGASSAWLDGSHLGAGRPLIIDLGSPAQVTKAAQLDDLYIDLDALLVGRRPVSGRQIEALEDEVALGVADFRLSQVRRGLRHVVELNHRTYEELAYRSLPQELDGLSPDHARQIETRMRGLLRRYSRAVLRAVEDSSKSQ